MKVFLVVVALFAAFVAAASGHAAGAGSPIDRLLDQIAAGGSSRETAADELAALLNGGGAGVVASADPAKAERAVDAVLDDAEPLIGLGRPTCGSWADKARYEDLRSISELVIDIAGRAGSAPAVRRSLRLRDPYLAAWGIRAAGYAGLHVDERTVDAVARDDYARWVLLYGGDSVVSALPRQFRTEEQRARADMAYWLTDPGELACQAADLVLMKAIQTSEGTYYVFKFRAGGGAVTRPNLFMAGISGPWRSGRLIGRLNTFSDFRAASAASAEGHLRRILAILRATG